MKQKCQRWRLMPGSGCEVLESGLEKEIFTMTPWVELRLWALARLLR
jgi:hypothetical protein